MVGNCIIHRGRVTCNPVPSMSRSLQDHFAAQMLSISIRFDPNNGVTFKNAPVVNKFISRIFLTIILQLTCITTWVVFVFTRQINRFCSRSLRSGYVQLSKSGHRNSDSDCQSNLEPNTYFQGGWYFWQPQRPGRESSKRSNGSIWLRWGM